MIFNIFYHIFLTRKKEFLKLEILYPLLFFIYIMFTQPYKIIYEKIFLKKSLHGKCNLCLEVKICILKYLDKILLN